MKDIIFLNPDKAYHETNAPVIAVKVNEVGWWPIHTLSSVDSLNGGPLPPGVAQSALDASMFGWHCPAAEPVWDFITSRDPL